MFVYGKRSRSKLEGVHSDLVMVASRALLYTPIDFAITEGVRSFDRQQELFDRGMSQTMRSKHLLQRDGFAHAIDVMATGDINGDGVRDHVDKNLTWDRKNYSEISDAFKAAARELGIKIQWGGDWRTFFDGPHFELTP